MKKNIANKIKLGMFITLGIAVFVLAIYFIGERQQLFRNTFRLSGVFKDVAGLQAGNNVRLSGINVGTVENISLVSDTSVRVDIIIDESTRKFIKKDAVATIGSEGLMGNKVLIINPGTGGKKVIENNDVIKTSMPIDIDDVLMSLKKTIDNTSNITSDLSLVTNNIQSGKGTIGRLLMDHSLAQNFDSSIVNLNQGLTGINNILNDAERSFSYNFDSTLINLREGSVFLRKGLFELNDLMREANKSMAKNIDSTFINLKDGTKELKILLQEAQDSWLLWGF
ncbi:MAG: MCE family protein [Ignavibacteriales bacterium]|nr:MCE family protein [Ignavibacteriales bacterium]